MNGFKKITVLTPEEIKQIRQEQSIDPKPTSEKNVYKIFFDGCEGFRDYMEEKEFIKCQELYNLYKSEIAKSNCKCKYNGIKKKYSNKFKKSFTLGELESKLNS